jgi:hypothetical protein
MDLLTFRFSFPIWPEITYLPENWVHTTPQHLLFFRDTSCVSHSDRGQKSASLLFTYVTVLYLLFLDHSAQSPTSHLYMSVTSISPRTPSELEQRHSSGTSRDLKESSDNWCVGNEDIVDTTSRSASTAPLTRNWTSLQDHADTVREVTASGGGSTPRPEHRREGFTWEVSKGAELNDQSRRRVCSKGVGTRDNPRDDAPASDATLAADFDTFNPPHFKRRTSTALSLTSTFGPGVARRDTASSSTSSVGSIARGVMRHVPDIRMFAPDKQKSRKVEDHGDRSPRPDKSGRTMSVKLRTALKKRSSDEKMPTRVHLDAPGVETAAPTQMKGGLKARRNMDQVEAMKLTLPLDLPNLPPRRKMSMPQSSNLQGLALQRPRSPYTPWKRDTAPSWEPMAEVPPMILEDPSPYLLPALKTGGHGLLPGSDPITSSVPPSFNERPIRMRKYINRPRYTQGSSHNSERSIASLGAFASDDIQTQPVDKSREPPPLFPGALKQVNKQSRRWRWSSPFSSSDVHSGESLSYGHDPMNAIDRRCSFSNLFRAKRNSASHDTQSPISPFSEANNDKNIPWHRDQNPNHKYGTALALANMPTPPSFIPPGLTRVPTPPIPDDTEEVKDTLADFVFKMDHMPRLRPSPGLPSRVWDSDAILMSQESNITSHSSDGDESTRDPLTPLSHVAELIPGNMPDDPWATHFSLQGIVSTISPPLLQTPLPPGNDEEWFRVPRDADSNLNTRAIPGEEARAKFEWLTPEHLPNSPLCPLNVKYRGQSKGTCLFHGRANAPGNRGSSSDSQGLQTDGETPTEEGFKMQWERGFLAHRRRMSMSSP